MRQKAVDDVVVNGVHVRGGGFGDESSHVHDISD